MSAWGDIGNRLIGLSKTLAVIDERFKRQEEDLKELKAENYKLRDELASLTTRVAVLEEGRKTVTAEVKAALTETVASWEIEKARREAQQARDEADRLRPLSPPGDD